MKIKKITVFVLSIVLILVFCGCGGRSTSSNKNTGGSSNQNNSLSSSKNTKSVEELLTADLDASMTPKEKLTPSKALTNALLNKVHIIITKETSTSCTLTFQYPDVATPFKEQLKNLGANPTDAQVNSLFDTLTKDVTDGKCKTLEETYVLNISKKSDGNPYLEWTKETINALTGGLYGLLEEDAGAILEKYETAVLPGITSTKESGTKDSSTKEPDAKEPTANEPAAKEPAKKEPAAQNPTSDKKPVIAVSYDKLEVDGVILKLDFYMDAKMDHGKRVFREEHEGLYLTDDLDKDGISDCVATSVRHDQYESVIIDNSDGVFTVEVTCAEDFPPGWSITDVNPVITISWPGQEEIVIKDVKDYLVKTGIGWIISFTVDHGKLL